MQGSYWGCGEVVRGGHRGLRTITYGLRSGNRDSDRAVPQTEKGRVNRGQSAHNIRA